MSFNHSHFLAVLLLTGVVSALLSSTWQPAQLYAVLKGTERETIHKTISCWKISARLLEYSAIA